MVASLQYVGTSGISPQQNARNRHHQVDINNNGLIGTWEYPKTLPWFDGIRGPDLSSLASIAGSGWVPTKVRKKKMW